MIALTSNDVPEITGLILIDCWEPDANVNSKKFLHRFYVDLIQLLSKFNFGAIVNASSGCKLDETDHSQKNTIWNYSKRFQFDTSIKKTHHHDAVITNWIAQSSVQSTAAIINHCLLSNSHSFMINNLDDFGFHCQNHLNDQHKNWLVVGQTWSMCTHTNNISLPRLRSLIPQGHRFYTVDSGFCKINGDKVQYIDYVKDNLKYELIYDFGYQLL